VPSDSAAIAICTPQFIDRESQGNRAIGADGLFGFFYQFAQQPGAVDQTAAVFIGPAGYGRACKKWHRQKKGRGPRKRK